MRELYTVDHTYNIDDPPNFPVVYLVKTTDDGSGDPNAPQAEPALIPEEVQTGVNKLLSGPDAMDAGNWLPAEIIWIADAVDAPYTPTDTVAEGGAVIKLGNIFPQPDGSVLVSASLYLGELAATGKTYVLNLVEASWRVTGYTGVQWMR